MARVYVTASGSTLVIPDSSIDTKVVTNPSGLATSGVIALVGEADQGPQWSQESRLSSNVFGPGDINRVIAKYGSGRLVDSFRGAVNASSSAKIQGSASSFILVKSNQGIQASKLTNDKHGTILADLAGAVGNNIKETISTSTDEVAPSTANFSYVPSSSAASADIRVNGSAKQALAIPANTTPDVLASSIIALSNLNAVGGVNNDIMSGLTSANQIALAVVSGQNVTISLTAPAVFGVSPSVGDTLNIPAGSVIEGTASANVGWYIVTAVSNSASQASISATKVTAGAPVAVASVALSSTPSNDLVDYSPIQINNMSGTDRQVLNSLVGTNASITVAGPAITFSLASGQFNSSPQIGDLLYIPTSSAFAAAGSNVGWYQVSALSNVSGAAFVTASRLSNGSPVAVSSTAIAATSDVQVMDRQIRGIGKSMQILDNAGAVNINTVFLGLAQTTAATWIGEMLTSSAELVKNFSLVNSSQNISESISVGGHVAFEIGYHGTTATCTIAMNGSNLILTTSVTGGTGTNLNINLSNIQTIADLVTVINGQIDYFAQAGSGIDAQRSPMILDQISNFGICADEAGVAAGLVKRDIWDLTQGPGNIAASSVQVSYVPTATAGLPDDEGPYFLSGGARGATTALQMAQSISALATVRCNFVVPLVSQDASVDATQGLTDPNSTYTVDATNAAVRAHVIAMSTAKVKRHRVAQCSKLDTFANQQSAAEELANYRCTLCFQNVKDLNSQGAIITFQPWMAAAKVAGMQAAGFYKAIYNKSIQISGVVNPSGFDDQDDSLVEQSILSGMIPISQMEDGSFRFRTDQTTYGVDNNFVYNSLQAVYVADIIALSLAQSVRDAFVGASVADVNETTVISYIKAKMEEFLNKKLIIRSPSQGAPGGWVNIDVTISDDVLLINTTVIEATSIRFAPIDLAIEGIQSSAAA